MPKTKAVLLGAALISLGLGSLQQVQAISIVQNGGFEEPSLSNGTFQLLTSIPGWQLDSASQGTTFEVQNNVAGSPYEGNQFIEVDSNGVTKIFQDLVTEIGKTYELTFAFSARPGVADNQLDVEWGGSPVVSLSASGVGLSNTNWNLYSYLLTATSTTTRLSFGNLNETRNTVGSYLDDVKVTLVPDSTPIPTPAPLLGLIGLGAAALRKKGQGEPVEQEA